MPTDIAGRFQMMPWGTDQTWQWTQHLNFENGGGVLFSDCLAAYLGEPAPTWDGSEEAPCPPLRPIGGFSPPPSEAISVALGVPAPGRVTVAGRFGRPPKAACAGTSTATAAGHGTVVCGLTDRFAALLHRRWRRVRIELRFQPSGDTATSLRRSIRLPRH